MQPGCTHANYFLVGRMSRIVYVIVFGDGRLGSLEPGVESHCCTAVRKICGGKKMEIKVLK